MNGDDRQLAELHMRERWELEQTIARLERNLQPNLNVWRELFKAAGPTATKGSTEQELKDVSNR